MASKNTLALVAFIGLGAVILLFFAADLLKNKQTGVAFNFEGITRPIQYPESPSQGDAAAKLALFEFGDFTCPYCKAMQPVIAQVAAAHPDALLVWKDFPFRTSQAKPAAIAARCADAQGKFWPYKAWLFANQDQFSQQAFISAAASLGLDSGAFTLCLADEAVAALVDRDFVEGVSLGIDETPTLVIGDTAIVGAVDADTLERVVAQELAKIQ